MIGVESGFITLVKNEWPQVTSLYCSLHRYTLASNTLPLHLMEVMDVAVKVVNFICSRAKNHRLFRLLAKEMGAQHVGLLFRTKVRWLSRDKYLTLTFIMHLYGTIKVHKQGNPARPAVSMIDTPEYNLAKFLIKLLNPTFQINSWWTRHFTC